MEEYKLPGIYCIENLINGKRYIGQAENIYKRFRIHRNELLKKRDNCTILQNAWNKYGKENFIFYTLLFCEIENLDLFEKFFIKFLHSHASEWGYNISWGGNTPMRGRKHTEESKLKLSIAHSGENNYFYGKHHTEETILKLRVPKSEETKNKLSIARKGTFASEETKEKMSKSGMGKVFTQETRDKLSESLLGVKHSNNTSSKYVGISLKKDSKKWVARTTYNETRIYIGIYETEEDAALAYNNKVTELYGDKAKLNIIEDKGDLNK
jgi:group I intron endonuclease